MTDKTETGVEKKVLVMARNNHCEAMRVAAGLTIFGHQIDLVFMYQGPNEQEAESEQAELLELCDIVPRTTVSAMQSHFEWLDAAALAALMKRADVTLSV